MLISATGLRSSCILFKPRICHIRGSLTLNTSFSDCPAQSRALVGALSPARFQGLAVVLFPVQSPEWAGTDRARFPVESRTLFPAQLPAVSPAQSLAVFLVLSRVQFQELV